MSLYAMSALYVVAGLVHLLRPAIYLPAMPPYLPHPAALVAVSGVCQIALGLLLLWPRTRRAAALGLVLLLIAVFPANVHMAQSAESAWPNVPAWLLFVRLPLQGVLIWWAYGFARTPAVR